MKEIPEVETNAASDLDSMKSDIIKEVTRIFNGRVKTFFENAVPTALETLVETRINELAKLDQSSQNTSVFDQTFLKCDTEERIAKLEEMAGETMDKIDTKLDELRTEIKCEND